MTHNCDISVNGKKTMRQDAGEFVDGTEFNAHLAGDISLKITILADVKDDKVCTDINISVTDPWGEELPVESLFGREHIA